VLSQGYNGFPRSFHDDKNLYENRQVKYKYIVHAEMNCIYHATLNGVSLENSSLFVYGLDVCSECAKAIVQVGIKQVFTCSKPIVSDYWRESFVITENIFKLGDIHYEKCDYESLSKYTS
jgi:dCMP deaminase